MIVRLLAPAAVVALALGACNQEARNDAATTDLQMNSAAPAVDQAINQTDEQSGLDNAVGETANDVTNAAE